MKVNFQVDILREEALTVQIRETLNLYLFRRLLAGVASLLKRRLLQKQGMFSNVFYMDLLLRWVSLKGGLGLRVLNGGLRPVDLLIFGGWKPWTLVSKHYSGLPKWTYVTKQWTLNVDAKN